MLKASFAREPHDHDMTSEASAPLDLAFFGVRSHFAFASKWSPDRGPGSYIQASYGCGIEC